MASRAANCVRLKRCSPKVACAEQAQRENDRRKERGILAGRSKKNCGPHLTAVLLTDGSQVCIVYRLSTRVVPCAAPRISFPPPLPHRRTCLLATGKNSAAPKRTFSSALVSAGWRAQRENDRRKERGILAGRSKKNCGPHLTAVLLTDGSQVCIVYRLSTRVVPCAALAFPSLRRFPTRRSSYLPQGKILPHPSARSALHSSPQDGGPKDRKS